MPTKTGWILLAIATLVVLAYTLPRDSRWEQTYAGDLRNRVVGARLIKDGHSPYFYKWKAGAPMRYYNPAGFDSLEMSVMTASPFFHHLLSPLAEMPEAPLSRVWLVLEYAMLITMSVLAFFQAGNPLQRQAVVLVPLLFLFTYAWVMHIGGGQNYICIPFFAMLFFVCARQNKKIVFAFAAGTAAACLVLIRINTVLFFLPFVFVAPIARQYSPRWLLTFCIPVLLLAGWTVGNKQERQLWQDYNRQISGWIKVCQEIPTAQPVYYNGPAPRYNNWEGIDMQKAGEVNKTMPKIYSENGNVFVLFKLLFHRNLSTLTLALATLGICAFCLLLFYLRNRPPVYPDLAPTAIFGFCLYMVSDLFSPFYRHQYYTVQWIFPLLLAASIFQPRRKALYIILLAGLGLNCIHLPFLKMQNTIGEYGILAALLMLSTFSGRPEPQKPTPASLS
ncbi:MAG TPA: hypothetical protein VGM30_05935 [Puia sp.]|jgi:hypothetical protein